MCSVMKSLFLWQKELFDWLFIQNKRDWTQTNPVIYISFASFCKWMDPSEYLLRHTYIYLEDEEYELWSYLWKVDILELLKKIYEKTNKQSVIIIDEYDKPVLEYLADSVKAEEMRSFFRNFYAPIKDSNKYLRFFRLSGLTKVMKMNIFSVLNNLRDVSLNSEYSSLIWYTQDEIEENFAEEIEELTKKEWLTKIQVLQKIKERYNGFNFGDGENKLYNPRDINNLMLNKQFKYYRADTGIPSGIKEYVEAKASDLNDLVEKIRNRKKIITETSLSIQDLKYIDMSSLFFQSWYLTIDEVLDMSYVVKFPNKQADFVFTNFFMSLVQPNPNISNWIIVSNDFYKWLFSNDSEIMQEALHKLIYEQLADTPTDRLSKNPEWWLKSFIWALLRLSTVYRRWEVPGLWVRADLLIVDKQDPEHCRVVEAKIDKSCDEAILQITNKYEKTVRTKFSKISKIWINRDRVEEKVDVLIVD